MDHSAGSSEEMAVGLPPSLSLKTAFRCLGEGFKQPKLIHCSLLKVGTSIGDGGQAEVRCVQPSAST